MARFGRISATRTGSALRPSGSATSWVKRLERSTSVTIAEEELAEQQSALPVPRDGAVLGLGRAL